MLLVQENAKFAVDTAFDFRYLSPVGQYVQWKLDYNHWDDYNELYHASKLVEDLKKHTDVWFDTHCLFRDNIIIGVLLIVGGNLKKLETKYDIKDQSLLLKYFHIVDKGNGYGSFWLKSVILPHYKQKGYQHIFVNSSHPDSFPFYNRLGSPIANYEQMSDNRLYKREGSCFRINL